MESHTEERRKDNDLWETNKNMAVNVIRDVWGLKQFQEEEIHFVCGILEVMHLNNNVKTNSFAGSSASEKNPTEAVKVNFIHKIILETLIKLNSLRSFFRTNNFMVC